MGGSFTYLSVHVVGVVGYDVLNHSCEHVKTDAATETGWGIRFICFGQHLRDRWKKEEEDEGVCNRQQYIKKSLLTER